MTETAQAKEGVALVSLPSLEELERVRRNRTRGRREDGEDLRRSLANQSPAKYRGGGYCLPDQKRLENSLT